MSLPRDLSSEFGAPIKPTARWREALPRPVPNTIYQGEPMWMRLFAWGFLLFAALYYYVYARDADTPQLSTLSTFKTAVMVGLSQSALLYLYLRAFNYIDIGPGIAKVKPRVPNEDACAVAMTVRQNGAVTGYDQGFAWLQSGSLYYKGFQTSFRLNRQDIPPLALWPKRDRPRPGMGRGPRRIPAPVGERDLTAQMVPIDPFEDHESRRRSMRFTNRLFRWLAEGEEAELESLFPPTDLHSGLPWRFKVHPLLLAACMAGVDLTVAFAPPLPTGVGSMPELSRMILTVVCVGLAIASFVICSRLNDDLHTRQEIKSQPEKIG